MHLTYSQIKAHVIDLKTQMATHLKMANDANDELELFEQSLGVALARDAGIRKGTVVPIDGLEWMVLGMYVRRTAILADLPEDVDLTELVEVLVGRGSQTKFVLLKTLIHRLPPQPSVL